MWIQSVYNNKDYYCKQRYLYLKEDKHNKARTTTKVRYNTNITRFQSEILKLTAVQATSRSLMKLQKVLFYIREFKNVIYITKHSI